MLINEVCKECHVTKKAIEYYIEQGLIAPSVQENGYRNFSDKDVLCLKKISILRNLGLSVTDIRAVLSSESPMALSNIYQREAMKMTVLQEKQKLIQELAEKQDWEHVQDRLQQLQKKQSVLERFLAAFPGYYGNFLCLHFAPYLSEPILTDKQQEAFDRIVSFLDRIDFDIPADLKTYLDEAVTIFLDENFMENLSSRTNVVIHETEKYIADNKKELENYFAYKQSEEYKATPAYRLEEALRQFNRTSGYNDIFIPAMCQLSEAYRKYHEELIKADEKFVQNIPTLKS